MLKAALVSGMLAGVVVAFFHLVLAERVIDRAIQLEHERNRARGVAPAEPVIGRPVQKVGLVVGFILYGAVWGLVFGAAYAVIGERLPAGTAAGRIWVLAALAGWSVAVFPFAKYPANPPGVGDPASIWYRQALYFGFAALSIAGVGIALALSRLRRARESAPGWTAWRAPLAIYAAYVVVLYLVMPANPDPVRMPAGIVWTFRSLSLVGLVLFWASLGAAFSRLEARSSRTPWG